MREMKNSGVEWIGEIPKEWKIKRLKMIFGFGKGLPITKENLVETGIPVISYGQIHAKFNLGTKITDDLIRFVPDNYVSSNSESLVHKGDILVADTSEDIEGCGNSVYVDKDVMLFAGYHTIILKSFNNGNKYLAYLFKTDAWRSQIRSQVSGVKLFSITKRILSSVTVILPPIHEQTTIASYLDKKCSNIDAIITKNEQIIEKLKEYKSSLITKTVTKGLNPDAEMKDSGVEWIGEIPAEWKIVKVKYTGYFENGLTYSPNDITDETGILVLRSSNIQSGNLDFNDCIYVFSAPEDLMVKRGDIIICSRNGSVNLVGKSVYIDNDIVATFGAFMMRYRTKIFDKFAFYMLQHVISYYKSFFATSTINQLTIKTIRQMVVALPSKSEQTAIANYLDEKCSIIDANIKKREIIIEKLAEYKKSLIYEVVTGKKEII